MSASPLRFSTKLCFGVGQVAEGLKNISFSLFVLFYYNQVLGVPGSLCGLALGIALLFDAVTDPLVGSLSDNWHSRWGRRHPFMYVSALPLGLAFWGLFSPPALGTWGLFAWLLSFAVLSRAAMTLYHVPHMALGAELTSDFQERTSVVAYRQGFGYVGALLAVAIGFGSFFSDASGGRLNAGAYSPFAGVLGALMLVTIWASAYGTRKEVARLPEPTDHPESKVLRRLWSETRSAFRNGSFRWLFSGVLVIYVMVGVDSALALYMFEFFWSLGGAEILTLAVAYPIGLIAGAFCTRALHAQLDKRSTLVIGTLGWALCQLVPVVLRLLGLFPENGTTALVVSLAGFRLVQGLIVQQAMVSFGSMMADVADEHELECGRRQEGIFFGAVAFSGKGAAGIGNMIAGFALDLISWPAGAAVATASNIAPQLLVRLGLIYGPAVAAFAAVSIWCYAHYGLSRERHEEITARLAEVRSG